MPALLSADAVRAQLAAACLEAGSQRAWAAKHGIGEGLVSDVIRGRREPGPAILGAMGLVRAVAYRRAN